MLKYYVDIRYKTGTFCAIFVNDRRIALNELNAHRFLHSLYYWFVQRFRGPGESCKTLSKRGFSVLYNETHRYLAAG